MCRSWAHAGPSSVRNTSENRTAPPCSTHETPPLDYHATAENGSQEDIHIKTFGGSQTIDSAGGTRWTTNHNKTAGQFFSAVTAWFGFGANAYAKGVDGATAQAASASAERITVNGQNTKAATDALQITTDGANKAAEIAKLPQQ